MIKFVVLIGLVALLVMFLVDPAFTAGRAIKKRFKAIWESTDENTNL